MRREFHYVKLKIKLNSPDFQVGGQKTRRKVESIIATAFRPWNGSNKIPGFSPHTHHKTGFKK